MGEELQPTSKNVAEGTTGAWYEFATGPEGVLWRKPNPMGGPDEMVRLPEGVHPPEAAAVGPDSAPHMVDTATSEQAAEPPETLSPQEVLRDGWIFDYETPDGQVVITRGREVRFVDKGTYEELRKTIGPAEVSAPANPEEPSLTPAPSTAGAPQLELEPEPSPREPEPAAEEETQEIGNSSFEKLRDQNTDPRVILKLKQKVEEKYAAMGGMEDSLKTVMGIREATRHLLAQGLEIDDNGDFKPEGMRL